MTGPVDAARLLLQQCYGSAELQTHLTGADTGCKGVTDLLCFDMPQRLYAKNSCRRAFAIGASSRVVFWS